MPAHPLGMDIGIASFSQQTTETIIFSLLFSVCEAIIISLYRFILFQKSRCKVSGLSAGSIICVARQYYPLPFCLEFTSRLTGKAFKRSRSTIFFVLDLAFLGLFIFCI